MDSKLINKMTDILDEVAMIYYDATVDEERENTDVTNFGKTHLHSNFYESLIKVTDYYIGEYNILKDVDEEAKSAIDEKLDELTKLVEENNMTQEMVRRALLMLDIKGFKNLGYSLDLITPDAICLIMNELVKTLCDKEEEITIYDPCMGVGNSVFYSAVNTEKEVNIIGMDSHELMARVAAMKANLLQVPLEMHFDDAMGFVPSKVSIVSCDVPTYEYENENSTSSLYHQGVRYFPYLLIDHLLNMPKGTKYVYLIDNDFFSHDYNDIFRSSLSLKANIKALIALPSEFFSKDATCKSILILDNNDIKEKADTVVYQLPSITDKENFLKVLNNIKESLK